MITVQPVVTSNSVATIATQIVVLNSIQSLIHIMPSFGPWSLNILIHTAYLLGNVCDGNNSLYTETSSEPFIQSSDTDGQQRLMAFGSCSVRLI